MRLTYETAIATLIQFIVLGLLNLANTLNSVVSTCHRDSSDCVGNIFVSIVLYMLLMTGFGFICLLGFVAQDRRNKLWPRLLIICEGFVALIGFFNTRPGHHNDTFSLLTSVVALLSALWICLLAFRLMRSGGGRVTRRNRARRRRPPTP